jgi:hypothetical protein
MHGFAVWRRHRGRRGQRRISRGNPVASHRRAVQIRLLEGADVLLARRVKALA